MLQSYHLGKSRSHVSNCLSSTFLLSETALHIYNRQPMCRLDWSPPISKWNGKTPGVSYFKIFGCLAYVFIPKEDRQNKLSAKAKEATFIGYEKDTKGYRFWSPKRRQVVISSTATFNEFVFPHCSRKHVEVSSDMTELVTIIFHTCRSKLQDVST